MSDINITVDSRQVVDAKRDITDLERSFSSAYKSAQTFMSAFARTERMDAYARSLQNVARANQEIINKNLNVSNSYKSAEDSANSFIKVLENQERAARAATTALNERMGITGPSATQSGAGFAALEAQIERLRTKYDSVYAASQLYEQNLNEINQAHMLGAINAKQHEAALEQLNKEYQQFQNGSVTGMNRFEAATQGSSQGMNQLGVAVQQFGYQAGDFLVQVQSGTNWMVAFGQQATQLAGLMTTFGGKFLAIGTALGIVIPLVTALGAAWMRTRQETNETSAAVETFDQKLKSLDSTLQDWILTKKAAQSGMTVEEFVGAKSLEDALADLSAAETAVSEAIARIQSQRPTGLTPGAGAGAALFNFIDLAREQANLDAAVSAFENAQRVVATLRMKQASEGRAYLLEEKRQLEENARLEMIKLSYGEDSVQAKAAVAAQERRLYEETLKTKNLTDLQVSALMKVYDQTTKQVTAAGLWKDAVDTVKERLEAIDGMDLNVSLRIKGIWDNVPDSIKRMFGFGTSLAPEGGRAAQPPQRPDVDSYGDWLDAQNGSGGGSGGGSSAPISDPLSDLRKQIELERELLTVNEAMARVIEAVGEDRKKYSEAELQAVAAEIQAYELKKQALEEQQRLGEFMKSSMEDAFMSIIDGTSSAKDAFKKFAYDVIRELYRVLVVQRLVGQFQIGGGGILGSLFGAFGGVPGRESGGSVMPGQPYIVGERGPELIVPRHSGTVLNSNLTSKAMSGGGEVTVVNNIQVPAGADSANIRAEVAKMIPQITQITKAAVIDAKQRGGQMGAAFR